MGRQNTIAHQLYQAINDMDEESLRKLFHPRVIRHAMGEIGIEPALEAMKQSFLNYPHTQYVVDDVLVDQDKIAARISIHGRDTPADKPLPLILEIFRIEDNQIVEVWGAGISSEKFPS
ncbi:MAG: nuclear transport factor 2 family protein [Anaerolineaceae bacterium]|nr:nuclear transport factor 2 family protein [Anaerolineaceae bacterium]MCB9100328.1 nuclear transport factor 2 family protein [Anaerolineales bacterium]